MNESNSIECNSLEAIDKTILSEQTKIRLSEIIGIENFFYEEINQRKWCSKKLNKYVTTFDLKKENEQLRKENGQLRKNNVDAKIKKSIEKPKEIKSLEEDENTTDWFDKNKFKEILAIIDSNKFNYRNKIGEFKYTDIRGFVNNTRNNTISKIDAKKDLNTLNKIKNAEIIKHKSTSKHKELLNLFNDLSDTILTDKTLMSSKDKNQKEKEKEKERENGNENEDYDDYENEDEDDD